MHLVSLIVSIVLTSFIASAQHQHFSWRTIAGRQVEIFRGISFRAPLWSNFHVFSDIGSPEECVQVCLQYHQHNVPCAAVNFDKTNGECEALDNGYVNGMGGRLTMNVNIDHYRIVPVQGEWTYSVIPTQSGHTIQEYTITRYGAGIIATMRTRNARTCIEGCIEYAEGACFGVNFNQGLRQCQLLAGAIFNKIAYDEAYIDNQYIHYSILLQEEV